MEVLAALVVLGSTLLLLVLVALRTRQLWPRRPVTSLGELGPRGGDAAGDREPRRPLVPAGTGSVALPLPAPEPEPDDADAAAPPAPGRPGPRWGLRAS